MNPNEWETARGFVVTNECTADKRTKNILHHMIETVFTTLVVITACSTIALGVLVTVIYRPRQRR